MLDLSELSQENLEEAQKILKIVLDWCQLQFNRLTGIIKIPLKKFEKEGFYYDEIVAVLNRINNKTEIIEIKNEWFLKKYNELREKHFVLDQFEKTDEITERWKKSLLSTLTLQLGSPVSEEDFKNYIILEVKELNKLKEISREVSRKIGGINKTKKDKPEEQSSKLIIVEEARKNAQTIADQLNKSFAKDKQTFEIVRAWFDALSTSTAPALEAYQQAVKNTEIQIEPFRRKLEENARVINTISKNFIMPNFEAIKPILKDIEEKTKEVNEMYNQSKKPLFSGTIISPKIIEAEQRNEIVSEIKKLRERVEELSSVKAEAAPQKIAEQPAITPKKTEAKKLKQKGKVEKITIVKMNDGKKLVAVNGDLTETREIKDYSEWWQIFIKEIDERNMRPETRSNVKTIPKAMFDYFNYNTKCPIYMGGKYGLTDVFVGRDIDRTINSEMKTNVMTERQYLARKNRKK